MKKHLITALVGVMILAVTAPAFAAANVGGNIKFGYDYNVGGTNATTDNWGLNVTGNVSEDVSYKLGFEVNPDDGSTPVMGAPQGLSPNEGWIQAKNTMIGSVKLGAFDLGFGQGNSAGWIVRTTDPVTGNVIDAEYRPLNVQVDNQIAGVNLSAGTQFNLDGSVHAAGASANMKPMEGLDAAVGVLATETDDWQPALGYSVNYTGIENLGLGLKGNLKSEEIVASADYQIMPEIKLSGMYGQNTVNVDDTAVESIMQAGASAAFGNLHGGASYEQSEQADGQHQIVRLNAGYDYELAKGLVVGLNANHTIDNSASATTFGVSAGVSF
ncbi:MAG: hypothetical protein ACM3XS_02465 [Bacteroidota bacterium]